MGLRVRLRPHEPVIVNGCVVTNGDRRNTLTVSSYGQILRAKYILQADEANTPARRLYFGVQTLLIEGGQNPDDVAIVNKLGSLAFVAMTTDEARARILTAMDHVHGGEHYKALCELRSLIEKDEPRAPPQKEAV
jgi:flagellar protein FlbT